MSAYTNRLKAVGEKLKAEGWDQRASIIIHAAARMDSMEQLIFSLMEGESIVKESKQQRTKGS